MMKDYKTDKASIQKDLPGLYASMTLKLWVTTKTTGWNQMKCIKTCFSIHKPKLCAMNWNFNIMIYDIYNKVTWILINNI